MVVHPIGGDKFLGNCDRKTASKATTFQKLDKVMLRGNALNKSMEFDTPRTYDWSGQISAGTDFVFGDVRETYANYSGATQSNGDLKFEYDKCDFRNETSTYTANCARFLARHPTWTTDYVRDAETEIMTMWFRKNTRLVIVVSLTEFFLVDYEIYRGNDWMVAMIPCDSEFAVSSNSTTAQGSWEQYHPYDDEE